jgi:AcrR family transcriptional regulator
VSSVATRTRNRRGEGSRLRDDIVSAAVEILETTGNPEAITLRAVARQVGIAAPSIYGHFADRESIIEAVVIEAFTRLTRVLKQAVAASADPVESLRSGCDAYLRFGAEHPHVYQLMFTCGVILPANTPPYSLEAGLETFGVLVGAIESAKAAGRSAPGDAFADATAVWVGLHGMNTLMSNLPQFPWSEREVLLDTLVTRLARLN